MNQVIPLYTNTSRHGNKQRETQIIHHTQTTLFRLSENPENTSIYISERICFVVFLDCLVHERNGVTARVFWAVTRFMWHLKAPYSVVMRHGRLKRAQGTFLGRHSKLNTCYDGLVDSERNNQTFQSFGNGFIVRLLKCKHTPRTQTRACALTQDVGRTTSPALGVKSRRPWQRMWFKTGGSHRMVEFSPVTWLITLMFLLFNVFSECLEWLVWTQLSIFVWRSGPSKTFPFPLLLHPFRSLLGTMVLAFLKTIEITSALLSSLRQNVFIIKFLKRLTGFVSKCRQEYLTVHVHTRTDYIQELKCIFRIFSSHVFFWLCVSVLSSLVLICLHGSVPCVSIVFRCSVCRSSTAGRCLAHCEPSTAFSPYPDHTHTHTHKHTLYTSHTLYTTHSLHTSVHASADPKTNEHRHKQPL